MKPSDLSHRVGGCALGAIISVISLNSWAEPELSVAVGGPTLTDSTVAQAKGLGVTLSVHSESTELVAEDLRAAIARELDEVVVLGGAGATDEGSRSIVVTYHPAETLIPIGRVAIVAVLNTTSWYHNAFSENQHDGNAAVCEHCLQPRTNHGATRTGAPLGTTHPMTNWSGRTESTLRNSVWATSARSMKLCP